VVGWPAEEPLKQAPEIAPDLQAGDALEKIRFRTEGAP